ncbi:hypothetical protein SKDZ_15G4310 [Saccharomyces kudriavzevii ZP591]|nr:hypothetical protein SKDZ_15G4310 [Saccharomyces kudriavzevii ZP591]
MAELDQYAIMIDIVLSDMDLKTVTTKKVRMALKEAFAIDVESQSKPINELIRMHLQLVKGGPSLKRSLEDVLRENATLAMKLTKEVSINKRSMEEEEEKNDDGIKDADDLRTKTTVNKSPISTRQVILSKSLANLLGEPRLTRTDVVRQVWAYIKEHDLQNPKNRKEILCDEKLELIFGKRTDMFKMHKILVNHMTDPSKTTDNSSPAKAVSNPMQKNI